MMGILFSLSSVLSVSVIFLGLGLSLVSFSTLGLWVGIELNFLGVACYLSGLSVEESESVMKYFIVQVLGSCFMVLGFLMMIHFKFSELADFLTLGGVMVKLGVFPFHFWVAPVMSGLSWVSCFVVSVVQKVVPLWVVCNWSVSSVGFTVVEVMACMTCMVGCLSGLGVLSFRMLLGFSSLVHLGLLIMLCCVGANFFWSYMVVYGLVNFCLMVSLWKLSLYSFSDLLKESDHSADLWWVFLYFISLAGLPPFTGSVLKVLFLLNCWSSMVLGCCVCVLSSAISLYFYLSTVVNASVYWGGSFSSLWAVSKSSLSIEGVISIVMNLGVGFLAFMVVSL